MVDVEKKARRRIKRFIRSNGTKPQARVHPKNAKEKPEVFEYKAKHHVKSLFFKEDKIGRLRLVKEKSTLTF